MVLGTQERPLGEGAPQSEFTELRCAGCAPGGPRLKNPWCLLGSCLMGMESCITDAQSRPQRWRGLTQGAQPSSQGLGLGVEET